MKKYIKISLILFIFASLSGILVSSIYMLTNDIKEQNEKQQKEELLSLIFPDAKIVTLDEKSDFNNIYIVSKDETDSSSNGTIGYIYDITGKNSFGEISLLVGISISGQLKDIQINKNEQSYSNEVSKHTKNEYYEGITLDEVENIDCHCGATKGATLVKELVKQCFEDFNKR